MKTMLPIQIKRALEDAGYTQVMIAEECNVSRPVVSQVIKGICVSHKVRCHIAGILKKPVEEVFVIKPNPTRTGPGPSVHRTDLSHS